MLSADDRAQVMDEPFHAPAPKQPPLDPKTLVLPDNASLFTRLSLALRILTMATLRARLCAPGEQLH